MTRTAKTVITFSLILLGFAAAIGLTRYLENVRPPLPQGYEDEDLGLQAGKLKGFVFGAEGLVADWYWMNALQYLGNKISAVGGLYGVNIDDLSSLNPKLLYPYLNNTVEMDPHFIPAYTYGAIVLPAVNVDDAIALTEKGIANNPDEWRLYHYLGYIYWTQDNFEKAAETYEKGSRIHGSPSFMPFMAAAMKTRGGSRETAREIYRSMIDESQPDSATNGSVKLRLMELDSLDERDAINAALQEFVKDSGKCPSRLAEIFPQLRAVQLPGGRSFSVNNANDLTDPAGFPYTLDQEKCRADLAVDSSIPKSAE